MAQWIFANDGGFLVRSDAGIYAYSYPTSPNTTKARRDALTVAQEMANEADGFVAGYSKSPTWMAQQQHFAECWDAAEARVLRGQPL